MRNLLSAEEWAESAESADETAERPSASIVDLFTQVLTSFGDRPRAISRPPTCHSTQVDQVVTVYVSFCALHPLPARTHQKCADLVATTVSQYVLTTVAGCAPLATSALQAGALGGPSRSAANSAVVAEPPPPVPRERALESQVIVLCWMVYSRSASHSRKIIVRCRRGWASSSAGSTIVRPPPTSFARCAAGCLV